MKVELVTTLKRQATKIPADLPETKKPVLITEQGRPSAYLVDVDDYEFMQNRLNILQIRADPGTRTHCFAGRAISASKTRHCHTIDSRTATAITRQVGYRPRMPRIARVLLPNTPHHVTQRGNRKQVVFFCREDYQAYLALISHWCAEEGVEIWSYCLMDNHVHLIVKPHTNSNMSRAIGEAHRRYTRKINLRENWKGYLWQGRYASFPMDEAHVLSTAAYIELNPVKAGMVKYAWDYPWSSVHSYLSNESGSFVTTEPLRSMVGDWKRFLSSSTNDNSDELEFHIRTGRPYGDESFINKASAILSRDLTPKKLGRRVKKNEFVSLDK